jgi:hypothetical protein
MKQWYALAPKMYAMSADTDKGYAGGREAKPVLWTSLSSAESAPSAYAESSNSVYAMSADTVYVRAKGFRVNKGFLDKSNFEGLLPTKENVYNSIKGLIDGDINECSIRQTCLRGQRNGNIAVRKDYVKAL